MLSRPYEEESRPWARSVSIRQSNGRPFGTDEGHHILDCGFGQIPDPPSLARKLSEMPGIVEHGLFIGMASVVLIASGSNVKKLRRDDKHGAVVSSHPEWLGTESGGGTKCLSAR